MSLCTSAALCEPHCLSVTGRRRSRRRRSSGTNSFSGTSLRASERRIGTSRARCRSTYFRASEARGRRIVVEIERSTRVWVCFWQCTRISHSVRMGIGSSFASGQGRQPLRMGRRRRVPRRAAWRRASRWTSGPRTRASWAPPKEAHCPGARPGGGRGRLAALGVPADAPQDANARRPPRIAALPGPQPPAGPSEGTRDSFAGIRKQLPASQPGLIAAPSLPESDDSDARRRSNAGGIKPPACAACCMCVADSTSATKLRRCVLQRGTADATRNMRQAGLSESLWARDHRRGDLRLDARIGVPELLRSASLDACGAR